jgi:purine-binding chemotaxis protein CheW
MAESGNGMMNQYLTFLLGEAVYGLDIGTVREVLELLPITTIPKSAEHMLGVINLRGHAVPVVDLRATLGMAAGPRTVDTCIVIFEALIRGETVVGGAVVDGVREVFELDEEKIEPPPRMGPGGEGYVMGMGRQDDRFIMILDIDRLVSDKDLVIPDTDDDEPEATGHAA